MYNRLCARWRRFWIQFAAPYGFGRIASALAAYNTSPYHGRAFLSFLHRRGYVANSTRLTGATTNFGAHVYLGDRVVVISAPDAGAITFGDGAQLYGDTFLQTGWGGSLRIGAGTHIQPGCHIHACVSDITIGREVEIAANCAIYSYNHGIDPDEVIMKQSLRSKGPISIGDGAWLGHGAIVLSGVSIGQGAVIGAGSVVSRDIPENAIAAGAPAKVMRMRKDALA